MELPCDLTPEQRARYDTAVEEWRILRVAVQQAGCLWAAAQADAHLCIHPYDCSSLLTCWERCTAGAGPPAVVQPRCVEDLLGHTAALFQAAVC